jgi:hypothetical protein
LSSAATGEETEMADEGGRIVLEGKVATTPKGLEARLAAIIKNPYLYS